MSEASLFAKDPAKVSAGRAGALRRWGPTGTRVVRLDELTAPQRRLVLALIDAVRREAARDPDHSTATEAA